MGATTAAAPEAVLERFDQMVKDRARIADQIGQAEAKISTLESERQGLLPRIAEGRESASARADSIDREKIHAQRQFDGLRMKLGEQDRQIAELGALRAEIYHNRAEAERRRRFESYRERIQRHHHNVAARWRAACRERFLGAETISELLADTALTQSQKESLVSEMWTLENSLGPAAIWNEAWQKSRYQKSPLNLPIPAAKPPDDKKHLEELK